MDKIILNKSSELKNEFSWSKSRDEIFRECLRKYYYDKYGFWGGWNFEAPTEVREIYILKQLKSRWVWKGDVVHFIIKDVLWNLLRGYKYPPEDYFGQLRARMRNDYKMSKLKRYREDPKKITGLFEHEYNIPVPDSEWKEMYESAVDCLKNFFASDHYELCKKLTKKDVLEVEQAEQFNFEGIPVWVKLDLAYKKDGKIFIVDWKTGKTRDIDLHIQLGCYILYGMERWGSNLDAIKSMEFNLTAAKDLPHEMDEEKLERIREYMRSSIAAMKNVLKDPKANIAQKEDFVMTDDLRACKFCNFKKLCGR